MVVRQESVRLSLDDAGFSTGMAQAAIATALLDKALGDLDGSNVDLGDGIRNTSEDVDGLGKSSRRTSSEIDTFSGRLGVLAKTAGALGPALVPLSAVAIGGMAGLASQLGFTVAAAGTAVLAFQGVGDALSAISAAQINPTTENLAKMRVALAGLSPAGRDLVKQLEDMQPLLDGLKNTAQAGFFPGLIDGLESIKTLAPEVNAIIDTVSSTLGDLAAEAGADLASDRWSNFFEMLATDARPTLEAMGHALGSVVHGLGQMWVAFSPLNRDFGSWIENAAKGFDKWATGLSKTQGFTEFMTYIRENGPRIADLAMAVADAILQIAEAAAPLGGPILEALTQIAQAIAAIADSPIGTPIMIGVSALSALSLAAGVATAAVTRLGTALGAVGIESAALGGGKLGGMGGGQLALTLYGLVNLAESAADSFQRLSDGSITLSDGLATAFHTLTPATFAMDQLGISAKLTGDKTIKMRDFLLDAANTAETATKQAKLLAGANDQLSAATQRANQRLVMQRQAARQASQAMVDWGNSLSPKEFSLDEWLSQIEKQIQAMRDLRINAIKAGENGVRDGLIKYLKSLGTEGALQLDRLANANADMVHRANRDWGSYRQEIQASGKAVDDLSHKKAEPKVSLDTHGFTGTANNAEHQLETLDHKRATPHIIAQSNADVISAQTSHVLAGVDHIKATPSINVTGADAAIANARGVQSAIDAIHGKTVDVNIVAHKIGSFTFADGGYTGPGDKYEAAGIVHRGEVVIPQEYVARDWSMLKARYGDLPGFAAGGVVPPASVSGRTGVDFGTDAWRRSVAEASQSATDLAYVLGHSSTSLDKAYKNEIKAREHRLSELVKGYQDELDAQKEHLDALKQEREAIMQGAASIIGAGHDLLGTTRTPVIPGVGSTGDITWTDSPATFASFSSALDAQFGTASQLKHVLQVFKRKHLGSQLLTWLITNGADIATLEDFANQSASDLQALSQQFHQINQVTHGVGNLASGAAGVNAEIRALRADNAQTRAEIRETNKKLDALNKNSKDSSDTLKAMHAHDPERTGEAAGHAAAAVIRGAFSDGQRRRGNG